MATANTRCRPITWYTKLDAGCNKQTPVVGRLLIILCDGGHGMTKCPGPFWLQLSFFKHSV